MWDLALLPREHLKSINERVWCKCDWVVLQGNGGDEAKVH